MSLISDLQLHACTTVVVISAATVQIQAGFYSTSTMKYMYHAADKHDTPTSHF